MKKLLLLSLACVTFLAVSCGKKDDNGKDPATSVAKQLAGSYDVTYSAQLTVTTNISGTQQVPIPERNTTGQLTASSDKDFTFVIDGVSYPGTADENSIKLQSASTAHLLDGINWPDGLSFIEDFAPEITIAPATVTKNSDGSLQWTSTLSGEITYSFMTIPITGTISYKAEKN